MILPKKQVRVRVAGILFEDDKLLLIEHIKNKDKYWLLPGGGVNFGESLDEALKREFMEELNINIDVHELALVCDSINPSGNRHIINMCFRCSYISGEYHLGNEERLYNYNFFNVDDLQEIQLYPPFNNYIVSICKKKQKDIYIGKLWLDK